MDGTRQPELDLPSLVSFLLLCGLKLASRSLVAPDSLRSGRGSSTLPARLTNQAGIEFGIILPSLLRTKRKGQRAWPGELGLFESISCGRHGLAEQTIAAFKFASTE